MNPREAEMILLLAKTGESSINFNTAFQAARALGRDTFQWQGKPYKAQTREEAQPRLKLPLGMRESDLYRDPAQEQINRNYYNATQQAERDYQQALRDISFDSTQAEKNALRKYTSDMAPFERNQLAQQQLQEHMRGLHNYETNELIQSTVNEELEKDRAARERLLQSIRELKSEMSLRNINRYEAAERDADEQLQRQRLMEWAAQQRQAQALEPVYPELLMPALPRALRGATGLLDRLRRPPRQRPREEPTFNLNSLIAP